MGEITRDMKWPPVVIECMLKCYYSREPYNGLERTPAMDNALSMLENQGMVEVTVGHDYHTPTPLGDAFVKMICNTPRPVTKTYFMDPRTDDVIL
jgi:hypothetical protein